MSSSLLIPKYVSVLICCVKDGSCVSSSRSSWWALPKIYAVLVCQCVFLVASAELNAVDANGNVRSFQLSSTSSPVIYKPATSATLPSIPPYCRSSLVDSCLQAEENGTFFYAPMENSVTVIKLTNGQTTIMKEAISLPCFPNDFATVSNSLLVACRDAADSETEDYCKDDTCGNIPADLNGRVTPITYSGVDDEGGSTQGLIIAATTSHQLVTFIVSISQRRVYNLPDDCSEPVNFSRQRSAVLLTCTNETQFWVNITDELSNVNFYLLGSNHGLLLALSIHGFALFLAGSQLTLQNILTGNAVTQTITIDNTNHTVFGDFTIDGKFAVVAVNSMAVLFIRVPEAITDNDGQHYHIMTTTEPLCPTCPAVQFLSTTIAIISSYNTPTTTVSVVLLTQWPPCVYMNKMLNDQPRQYWLNPSAPLPVSCGVGPTSTATTLVTLPSVTTSTPLSPISVSPTPNSSTSPNSDSGGLSSGAIAGIIVGIVVALIIIVVLVIFVVVFVRQSHGNAPEPAAHNDIPDDAVQNVDEIQNHFPIAR